MMQQWPDVQEADLPAIAAQILQAAGKSKVFALHGDLGAGKTTLVKAFCKHLNIGDRVLSPSFTIIHEYGRDPVYHIDLYRLTSAEEALAAGVQECLESGHYCFIEWPELLSDLLPADTMHIYIEAHGPDKRHIVVTSSSP
ncbi:MAG: tRNA (adenosine(37)-N6)-threonylcarbamoyltransferase complex ATPase subunit type 1 TsaE [Chitinophagales bacterium]|nr:tRNA (adenosine(37)-N6)-threonylcarbamoyltransferase complex ATPase subunit type 1 TsaE [Chitinophagales bacterium]MDW8427574.1 tRNA (adenosine(37)-N6)-threonylcarbamoyltransferase complex ATPase subunit type 1 TsaE [Chitinophagales bacterium]